MKETCSVELEADLSEDGSRIKPRSRMCVWGQHIRTNETTNSPVGSKSRQPIFALCPNGRSRHPPTFWAKFLMPYGAISCGLPLPLIFISQ